MRLVRAAGPLHEYASCNKCHSTIQSPFVHEGRSLGQNEDLPCISTFFLSLIRYKSGSSASGTLRFREVFGFRGSAGVLKASWREAGAFTSSKDGCDAAPRNVWRVCARTKSDLHVAEIASLAAVGVSPIRTAKFMTSYGARSPSASLAALDKMTPLPLVTRKISRAPLNTLRRAAVRSIPLPSTFVGV